MKTLSKLGHGDTLWSKQTLAFENYWHWYLQIIINRVFTSQIRVKLVSLWNMSQFLTNWTSIWKRKKTSFFVSPRNICQTNLNYSCTSF